MRIKTLTMVGNECEIIESFVRYNIQIVDEMVFIFDTGSVDNSMNILKKLHDEGINVRIYDEPLVSYEQRAMENKYLRMLASEMDTDIIIPLDADEFIASDINPREIIEKLERDYIYVMKWRNYILQEDDDTDEYFIPRRLTHFDKNAKTFDKVIIPADMVRNNRLMLCTGHHEVTGCHQDRIKRINDIFIAHYPLISREQYQNKIYCNTISFISWMNRADGEGYHLNRMLADLENQRQTDSPSSIYNISDNAEIVKGAIDLSFFDESRLEIRYRNLAHIDLIHNLVKIGQTMALKAYNLEIEKMFVDKDACRVLVFGTGKKATALLDGIQENLVNILAYVDSDEDKKFTRFKKRIVITPELIRHFNYDKIIISSDIYYNEMESILRNYCVKDENIVGADYLTDLLIEKLSQKSNTINIK